MLDHLLPSRFADARRALTWVAVVIGSTVTIGCAWRSMLLTVAVALGGCAALPGQVDPPVSVAHGDVAEAADEE